MAFVLKSQGAVLRNAGKIVDSKQILYSLMRILQSVAPPLHSGFVKRNFYSHFVSPPDV
jgi:hypothetical protein